MAQVGGNQLQEFTPGGVFMKFPIKSRSSRDRILLLYTPHHHTQMLSFDDYSHSEWVQRFFYCIHDFNGKPLLYLQAPSVNIYHPCYLAETSNPSIGDISDMGLAKKRKNMVFAHTVEFNILYHYHLTYRLMKFG